MFVQPRSTASSSFLRYALGRIGRLVLCHSRGFPGHDKPLTLFSIETFGYHLLGSQKEGKFLLSWLSPFLPPHFPEEGDSAPHQQEGQARVAEQAWQHVSSPGRLPPRPACPPTLPSTSLISSLLFSLIMSFLGVRTFSFFPIGGCRFTEKTSFGNLCHLKFFFFLLEDNIEHFFL